MKVIYSVGAKFGGPGIGTTAFHAASGIYRAGWLDRLFVSSNAQSKIPPRLIRQLGLFGRGFNYLAFKDSTGLISSFTTWLFDQWVAAQLPRGDILHGWNGMSLHSIRRAKQLGMKTVVERASAHPKTWIDLMREEYARWNVPLKLPLWNYARLIREFDETDFITVPSSFARESMIAEGVPAGKLIEIPFGADVTRFFPAEFESPHPFRIMFAGTVSINKGVPYLLDAWRQLNWRDAELWIVGAVAPDMSAIRERWTNLSGVRYLAHSNDLPDLMRQCDGFAFPSIQEGSALVNYEAMASGLPVITTPNSGSVVREGIEGFIVPIRDVDALAERMHKLRGDLGLRARMRNAALERAREFTWERYCPRLLDAYQSKML